MAKKKRKTDLFDCVEGDCLQALPALADGSVDLAFADPPYNIGYSAYDRYDDNKPADVYVAWCRDWMSLLHQKLKRHGTFWLAISDEFVSELDITAKQVGFHKRSHVIHYYTFGVACPANFARSHTHLLYYTKTKSKFTFNKDSPDLRVPSARQLVYNDKRANPKGKLPDNTWVLSPVDLGKAFSPEEDTWLVSRVCGTFHERQQRGTYQEEKAVPQMPLEILNRVITACSNTGELVVDPFLGNGTTGASAVALGRKFWGCDISPAYVARSRERIQEALG